MKILINNEEVVCSNKLEIKEEMLTASSTILNNCYPLSWETTKDYVNNYYYPKDYSKCLIFGNKVDNFEILGNTTQTTSQTGTNIFDGVLELGNYNSTTGAKSPSNSYVRNANFIPVEELTNYKLSLNGSGIGMYIFEYKADYSYNLTARKTVDANSYLTTNSGTKYINFRIIATSTDTNAKIQVQKGTVATAYEQFIPNSPTPNYPQPIENITGKITTNVNGKDYNIDLGSIELCKIDTYQDSIKKAIGKNLFDGELELGSINTSGNTPTNNALRSINYIEVKPNTTYTINNNLNYTTRIYEYNDSQAYITNSSQASVTYTFTTSATTKYIRFRTIESSTQNDLNVKIMLNEGSTALPYEPYGTGWYIEKQIGKTTLNGSESYGLSSNTNIIYYRSAIGIKNNTNIISNYYSYASFNDLYNANVDYGVSYNANNSYFTFRNKDITSAANFKTWLTTHNTIIYYVLPNTLYTQITDTDLIGELEAASNNLLFSGVIKNTGNIDLNPRQPHYSTLQALDFKTFLSEGNCLDFVIDGKTLVEAIQMVIDTVEDYGVELGEVNISNANDIINAYSTLNKTAYDVLQFLADSSNARWTTRMIDENRIAVDFFDPDLKEAIHTLEYTKEYWDANGIMNIKYNYGTYDYRNKQIISSNEVFGDIDYNEIIFTDGYNRSFNTTTNIGYVKSIKVDGVSKTFGTFEDREIGYDFDFYYQTGNTRIDSNEESEIYPSNSQIEIQYTPILKGRQIVYNNDEVDRISEQTGRNGVISRYEDRNDVSTNENLYKIARSYIKYKGSAEISLIVQTYNVELYNIGDIVYFNAPITELQQSYMVKQKIIETYNTNKNKEMFCEYTLTSSYNSESEVNYFDNQRNKTKGNIGVGEYITRNIDIENNVNIIFNNLQIIEN